MDLDRSPLVKYTMLFPYLGSGGKGTVRSYINAGTIAAPVGDVIAMGGTVVPIGLWAVI